MQKLLAKIKSKSKSDDLEANLIAERAKLALQQRLNRMLAHHQALEAPEQVEQEAA